MYIHNYSYGLFMKLNKQYKNWLHYDLKILRNHRIENENRIFDKNTQVNELDKFLYYSHCNFKKNKVHMDRRSSDL